MTWQLLILEKEPPIILRWPKIAQKSQEKL